MVKRKYNNNLTNRPTDVQKNKLDFFNKENSNLQNYNEQQNVLISFYSKYKKTIWLAAILLLTLVAYISAFDNDFVNWDDDRYITGNKIITELSVENVIIYFTEPYFVMYMPFTLLSYSFDYAIGGLDPLIYHIHTILLHLLNTALVFFFLLKLTRMYGSKKPLEIAIIVAVLFGVSTIHVQSVSWMAERKDVLNTVYFLLSLIFYLKYVETQSKKFIFVSLFSFLIALMTKGQAVSLSLCVVAIDWLLRRDIFSKKVILEKIPFFMLSLLFGIIALIAAGGQEPFAANDNTIQVSDILHRTLFEEVVYGGYGYALYFFKMIIPYHLSAIHGYPTITEGVIPGYVWFYLIPSAGIVGLMIYTLKRQREIAFGIAFFTFNIVLMLQILADIPFLISEHYGYISSIGVFFLIGFGYEKITEKFPAYKKAVIGILVAYTLSLTVYTYIRNDVWQNSLTMWEDVMEKYPRVLVAHYNRGNFNQELGDKGEKGKYEAAIVDYTETIRLNPVDVGAYSNRGVTRAKIGDAQGALADFDKVVSLDSTYANVYSNRGNVKVMLNQHESAIQDYTKAILKKADYTDAYFNRGLAFNKLSNFNEAIKDLSKVISLGTVNTTVYTNLVMAYINLNKFEEAQIYIQKCIELDPKEPNSYYYRAMINEKKGLEKEAMADYRKVSELFPEFIASMVTTATSYEQSGMNDLALEQFNKVIKIKPDYVDVYISRGVFFAKKGKMNLAIEDFNKAIKINPTNASAYSNRGLANSNLKNIKAAKDDYTKAIELDPKLTNAYSNRALLLYSSKDYEGSAADYSKLIEFNPQNAQAYYYRAFNYIKLNKKNEACNDFQKSQQLGLKEAENQIKTYCNNK